MNKNVKAVRKLTKSVYEDSTQAERTVLVGIARRLLWLKGVFEKRVGFEVRKITRAFKI